ncbi:tail fiber domain-containing protein [Xanthomonas phage RTH11]|nr:tail fiber domain-containing protein [Xanthomonas phage RTH11]
MFKYLKLGGLDFLENPEVGQHVTVRTGPGDTDFVNVFLGDFRTFMTEQVTERIVDLEEAVAGGTGPSVWPVARSLSLTGLVTGTVAMDGSQNVSLVTSMADGALSIAKVDGLQAALDGKLASTGNAATATRLQTSRNIALSGVVTGTASFNGSANATIATSIADGALSIAKTSGLQAALDTKANLSGADFTGLLTARGPGLEVWAADGNADAALNVRNQAGVLQGALAWDRATDSMRLRRASTDGAATEGEFALYGDRATINGNVLYHAGNLNAQALSYLSSAVTEYVSGAGANANDFAAGTKNLVHNTNANTPGASSAYWYIETLLTGTSTNVLIQRAYSPTLDEHYVRRGNAGVWSAWRRQWNSSNFDPTSKLDSNAVAASATKLQTARTIALTGIATGTVSFDGTANVSIATSVADGALSIAKTSGLQTALDGKLNVGQYGLGTASANYNWAVEVRQSQFAVGTTGAPESGKNYMGMHVVLSHADYYAMDLAARNNKLWFQTTELGVLGTWNEVYHTGNFTPANYVPVTRSVLAGNGILDGGALSGDVTLTLGTPTTLSGSTTNAVTAGSHTHALSANLKAWDAITVASKLDASATAVAAAKLATARTVALTGPVTASASFDGSANLTLATAVADGALAIAKINGLQAALDLLAPKANPTFTGTARLLGDLLPDVDNVRSLGAPNLMWKDVYIGPGSLYINGQKVLEDNSGTIRMLADPNQNIAIQTSGSGDIELAPTGTGVIQMKGTVSFLGGSKIRSSNGSALLFDEDIQFSTGTGLIGTPTINGNVIYHAGNLDLSSTFRIGAANAADLRFSSGDGRGIRFWDNVNYSIYMSATTNASLGGRIAGETTSDHNMYFRMAAGTNRGFVFENGYANKLFAINTNGVRSTPSITAPSFIGALEGNAASATKLGTARQIYLQNDLTGNAAFDGSTDISIAAYARAYVSGGTGSSQAGQYVRVARATIGAQYEDAAIALQMLGYSDAASYARSCRVRFRVKQQATLPGLPVVNVDVESTNYIQPEEFVAVIGDTAAYPVTVDLYVKMAGTYSGLKTSVLGRGGSRTIQLVENDGYVTALPSGTQVPGVGDNASRAYANALTASTVTATDIIGNLQGTFAGTLARVYNPNNSGATMGMEWSSNAPRLRIGGTGSYVDATFRIQGASDFVRMSLDAQGNMTIPGTLTASAINGNLNWSGTQYFEASNTHFGSKATSNVLLEIGGRAGTATSTGLDFHSSGGNNDFDTRIMATGGDGTTNGAGTLTVSAAAFTLTGHLNLPTSRAITFGSNSSVVRDAGTAGLVISTATGGYIYLRPNGDASATNQFVVNNTGVSYGGNDIWHAGNFNPDGRVERGTTALNQDGTVPAGFFTDVANQLALKMSNNTTGSTGYPSEFGATLSVIMGRQPTRSFDLHVTTGSPNFLYYRGYPSTGTAGGEWKTIAALQNANSWTGLQTFTNGVTFANDKVVSLGTGGGTLRATNTGSVVISSGTGGSGFVYLRPNGDTVTTGQVVVYATGVLDASSLKANASGSGAVFLEMAGERAWQFRQIGTGATSGLELFDTTGGKAFHVTSTSNSNRISMDGSLSRVTANEFVGALTGNAATASNASAVGGLAATSFLRNDAANSSDVRVASGDGRGLRFWDNDQYKIWMSASGTASTGGRIDGETTSDYNMYFRMASGTNRGFVFESTNAAKLFAINPSGVRSTPSITAPSFIGAVRGNADTATKLLTARTINGVAFDGSSNITIAVAMPTSIDVTGSINAGASLRSGGWGGIATNGVVYFGTADSYIFKSGNNFAFKNEEGSYTATLTSGGNIWTTSNLTPLDRNTGGSVLATLDVFSGAFGTQTGLYGMGYNNGVRRWLHVMESDASYALYSYNTSGGGAGRVLKINNLASGQSAFEALVVWGGIKSLGTSAGFSLGDRNGTGPEWSIYASESALRLWVSGGGDRFSINSAGNANIANGLVVSGRMDVGNQLYVNAGWVRSQQSGTGWYHEAHGGGIFMQDSQWVRTYNNKGFLIAGAAGNDGGLRMEGTSPTVTFYDTDSGRTNWLHCNDDNIGFLASNSFSWCSYRDGSNNWITVGNIVGYASDERLKTGIDFVDRQIPTDFFDRFRVREFDWNYEAIAKLNPDFKPIADHEVGGIAQEVEEIYPFMVTTHQNTGIKTIMWDKAVPLLISEVQELRKLKPVVDELLGRLAALEAKVGGA